MPKDLWGWLNFQVSKWQMEGTAHKTRHGGIWHRFQGELPGWADCGTWLDTNLIRATAGKGSRYPSPFAFTGSIDLKGLCTRCFANEIKLLTVLHQEQVDRSEVGRLAALAQRVNE